MGDERLPLTYVLPLKRAAAGESDELRELAAYLAWLGANVSDAIVVDGSDSGVFAAMDRWIPPAVRHLPVIPSLHTTMGKVGGVLTGVHHAHEAAVIIADDDVRYDETSLRAMLALLQTADLVRPQNYFHPAPWHALWDTARSLLNRMSGGDWPGTLGVRRDVLQRTGGYAGDVMFENLELERTVRAAGGTVVVALGLYVRRLPPTARQFCGQRARQAFDELARPGRLVAQLGIVPSLWLMRRSPFALASAAAASIAVAELGRRRAGGARVFPAAASLCAPVWVLERGVCIWLAVAAKMLFGGIPYRGQVVPNAAHSVRELRDARRAAS